MGDIRGGTNVFQAPPDDAPTTSGSSPSKDQSPKEDLSPPPNDQSPPPKDQSPPPNDQSPPPKDQSPPPQSPLPQSPPPVVQSPPPQLPPPQSPPLAFQSPPPAVQSPPHPVATPPLPSNAPPPTLLPPPKNDNPAPFPPPPPEIAKPSPLPDAPLLGLTPPLPPPTPPIPVPPGTISMPPPLTPLPDASKSPAPVGSSSSLKPPPSSAPAPSSSSSSSPSMPSAILIGGLVSGCFIIIMAVVLVACFIMKKKKKRKQDEMDPPPPKQGEYYNYRIRASPNERIVISQRQLNWDSPAGISSPAMGHNQSSFSYDQLAVATSGFSQANLLGQGGFGYVHKGVLPNGKEVAVKSLKFGSGQGEREFQAEVEIISRVHHRHLVSLVGFCIHDEQRMLVYEFVPNKTLEFHLHGKGQPVMEWGTRMRIALGSSKGLAYLHQDCHPRIIHRDIKAANILLDNNFEAMVADFGLAKLSSDNNTHVSTRVMGTFGYLAPEYALSGKLSDKSDVFSFGVMLLELITGRKPVDHTNDIMEDSLADWARPLMARALENGNYDELVDPLLENEYDRDEMACMVACAAASIRHSAKRRPKMTQIVRSLEGDASLDDLIDGKRTMQNSTSGSNLSSLDNGLYDTAAYNADMMKFKKIMMGNVTMTSSELGVTSEYGLNPSSSGSDLTDQSSGLRQNV